MNYFKILQLLRPHIKAGRLDYKGAILYLEKIGIKMAVSYTHLTLPTILRV